jgi:ABC-type uncharacterized transport system permease subunit
MTALLRDPWTLLATAPRLAGLACVTLAALMAAGALLGSGRMAALALRWTRAGFLLLGAALATGACQNWRTQGSLWPGDARGTWTLLAWLIFFMVLHVHRVKAFQGRPAAWAGLAGWALAAAAWFGMR